MHIKWENVFVALLLMGVLIMWANYHDHILAALSCIAQIPPGNDPANQWLGVLTLTVLCFTVACIVKLLIRRNQ